jgi:septal ring factor EnvC (AmiA/AmiB activator)
MFMLVAGAFTASSCDQSKAELDSTKTQLEQVSKERDQLKSQLDSTKQQMATMQAQLDKAKQSPTGSGKPEIAKAEAPKKGEKKTAKK